MKKLFLSVLLVIGITISSFAQIDAYIGEIKPVAFNYAPMGWMLCNGQTLPISQYQALFALLGTYYGGDGVTNFKLPDLRGRVLVHSGMANNLPPVTIGQQFGTPNVSLLQSNGTIVPSGPLYSAVVDSTNKGPKTLPVTINTAQPFNNYPPSLGINYIICVNGIWPQRD
jgi:microcystin-dependent protein